MKEPGIGASGVHHVASKLAFEGFEATVATDLSRVFVNLPGDAHALSLAVVASGDAMQSFARGDAEGVRRYEWEVGEIPAPGSFVALVDLKRMEEASDVFIVPSAKLHERFVDSGEPEGWRYRPSAEEIEPHKNAWSLLEKRLRWSAKKGWVSREELEERYGASFAVAFDAETKRLLEAETSTIHEMADERFSARELAEASALLRVLFRRRRG